MFSPSRRPISCIIPLCTLPCSAAIVTVWKAAPEKYPALNDADVQIELLLAVSVHASILVSNAVMLDLVELRKNSCKSAELGDVLYTLVAICCISADDDVRATITPANTMSCT